MCCDYFTSISLHCRCLALAYRHAVIILTQRSDAALCYYDMKNVICQIRSVCRLSLLYVVLAKQLGNQAKQC